MGLRSHSTPKTADSLIPQYSAGGWQTGLPQSPRFHHRTRSNRTVGNPNRSHRLHPPTPANPSARQPTQYATLTPATLAPHPPFKLPLNHLLLARHGNDRSLHAYHIPHPP